MDRVHEPSWYESLGGFILPTLSENAVDRIWDRLAGQGAEDGQQQQAGWRGRVIRIFSHKSAGLLTGAVVAAGAVAASVLIFPIVASSASAGAVTALGWTWAGIKIAGNVKDAAGKAYTHLSEGTQIGLSRLNPAASAAKNWTLDKADALAHRLFSQSSLDTISGAIKGLIDTGNQLAAAFGSEDKLIEIPEHSDYSYELRDRTSELFEGSEALDDQQKEQLRNARRTSMTAERVIGRRERELGSYQKTIAGGGKCGKFAERFSRGQKQQLATVRSKEEQHKADSGVKALRVKVLLAERVKEDRREQATRIASLAKAVLGAAVLTGLMLWLSWASLAAVIFASTTVLAVEATHVSLASGRLLYQDRV